ncbi:MAG: DUF421 domain-containing protein [Oscillospiraceae bacterium]
MDIIKVFIASIASIIVLFLLAKLIGNRQVNQMSLFDYIIGITIGSIAAEMSTALEGDFLKPLIAMIVYGVAAALIDILTCKSIKLRKILTGTPLVLFEDGKLFEKNLFASKLDINEFLTQCRVAGFFDLAQLKTAILETNGQISFMPLAENRPVTPRDLKLTPDAEGLTVNLILDGKVLSDNLKYSGKDDIWLKKQLAENGVRSEKEVFLATCDISGKLTVYKYTNKKVDKEIFE